VLDKVDAVVCVCLSSICFARRHVGQLGTSTPLNALLARTML